MDEQVAMIGDRVLPSPKAFVPSFLKEDEQFGFGLQMPSEDKQRDFSFDKEMNLRSLSEQKSSSRGGLAARIAARAGFNAPRLSTESIRSKNDLSYIDKVKSPYLTISPGISPSALLESPVFIANSQASPTTGKFQLFADGIGDGLSVDTECASKGNKFDNDSESSTFAFKPHREPTVPFSLSAAYKSSQAINPQELSGTEDPAATENAASNFGTSQAHSHESLSKLLIVKKSEDRIGGSQLDTVSAIADQSPPLSDQQDDREEHDQTIAVDPIPGGTAGGVSAEDGYHWRKYGQKQVKGSEFPRSYYRCMHNNCPVKKKVEMSPEGIAVEIIYKGTHNHPEAAPYQASSMASSHFDNNHGRGSPGNSCGDRGSVWGPTHNGLLGTRDWRNGSFEQNSIPLVNPEINHLLPSVHMQNKVLDSGEAAVGSSTYSNDDGQNDRGTHGSISNDEEDESNSKRRKIETSVAELGSGATRAIREPRVVVQTRSDVDILDDGYRWRKYGQKVVKGNPNPRSYYKCTYIGCTVRKHVERASNDHRSVITTYEGKHCHDVPAARNSNHTNSPISAAFASLPQNLTPPNSTSFNMPIMQTHITPPHGFPSGMNQSSLVGFVPGSNKIFGIPAVHQHPMQPQPQSQPQRMNNMGIMMPRRDLNYAPNIYTSNGSSGNCHVSNMTCMRH